MRKEGPGICPRLELKKFHEEILNGGAMPLDLLQERIELDQRTGTK